MGLKVRYKELGDLESEVLGVVEKMVKASVREVLSEIGKNKNVAYTTISTTLYRLYRKGFLTREEVAGRGGLRYIYSCADDASLREGVVDRAISKLTHAFGPSVIPTIYQRLEEVPEDKLRELKEKVRRERGK